MSDDWSENMDYETPQVMEVANPAERAAAGVDESLARWRGFSDEELQVIADRLAAGLIAQDPSQKRKDRARLIDEINFVQNRRETEKASYRGPGHYRAVDSGAIYEVVGILGELVIVRPSLGDPGTLMSVTRRSFDGSEPSSSQRLYEYLGPLEGAATAPVEVKVVDAGQGWAKVQTIDGRHYVINAGDSITVPTLVIS